LIKQLKLTDKGGKLMSYYSIKKNIDMSYEEAFGILSELDMKSIFKEKIDKYF